MSVQAYLVDGVYIRIRPGQAHKTTGEERNGWAVAGPSEDGYLAVAKREPFVLPGVEPFYEPGDVWFAFGSEPADLIDQLVAEVKAASRGD